MWDTWKEYSEDLHNANTVIMCGFVETRICNYFGKEPLSKTEVERRVRKFISCKTAVEHEVTREMIKSERELVID